ncbi:MAG: trigger factor [Chloroflexota bacterium]
MELKVTQEPLENCQVQVTVEVEQKRVDQELKKAARKIANQYQFPGFRKGKAPYSRVVQMAGKEALYAEFVDNLGQEVYKQVMEDEEIEPYATVTLTDVQYDPLRYVLAVPTEPEIDLGDYRSLRVAEDVLAVTDEQVEERLIKYQEEYADWQDVSRPSEYGDNIRISVYSVLTEPDEGEEETIFLDEEDWEVTPDQENPTDPPGFDEALLGLQVGDEKECILSWPEDSQSIYAGRSANFKINVLSVRSYENAELNDDLAQMIGPEFDTVTDLSQSVRETLEEEAKTAADQAYLGRSIEAIMEQSSLNYPPAVIEDQLNSMMTEYENQIKQYGIQDIDAYLDNIGQTREQLREEQREAATQIAERNLIISEIIQQEGLTAEDEDIDRQIKIMLGEDPDADEAEATEPDSDVDGMSEVADDAEGASASDEIEGGDENEGASIVEPNSDESEEVSQAAQQRDMMFQMFREGPGRAMIMSQVLTEKAHERLVAIAKGEELPEPTPLSAKEDESDSDESTSDNNDTIPGEIVVEQGEVDASDSTSQDIASDDASGTGRENLADVATSGTSIVDAVSETDSATS